MKKLADILQGLDYRLLQGTEAAEVPSMTFDSRKVEKGGLFVAVRGTQVDGHQYIEDAISQGAQIIVAENLPNAFKSNITYVQVNNTAQSLGWMAHHFYAEPSDQLSLVGITGTNGKTTVASLLYQLFRKLGKKTGLISTIDTRINDRVTEATHTTPDAIQINELLEQMVKEGVTYVFMEVSSHALVQERVAGINLKGGIFTNISHEHLDYHKTFDNYIKAKKRLFDMLPENAFALINKDDKQGQVMLQNTKAQPRTYALKSMADYKGKIVESDFNGMSMQINDRDFYARLTGHFNAYNLVAAYGAAKELGIAPEDILKSLSIIQPAQGRFELVKNDKGITGIVDYAHSPDALENVLKTIQSINQHKGRLFTVIGCGGNRDKEKRPDMARLAAKHSDQVILTSDNPRYEDPETIIKDMEKGIDEDSKFKILNIPDRKEAIKTASKLAGKGDIILVAGKGHEKFQEVQGQKKPFDDWQLLNEFLSTPQAKQKGS